MTDEFGVMLAFVGGLFVLGAALPFVASTLIDGVMALIAGRGAMPVVLAFGLTVVFATFGAVLWIAGDTGSIGRVAMEAFPDRMQSSLLLLLAFSVPLALLTTVLRLLRSHAFRFRPRFAAGRPARSRPAQT